MLYSEIDEYSLILNYGKIYSLATLSVPGWHIVGCPCPGGSQVITRKAWPRTIMGTCGENATLRARYITLL
jgi:hypothetical protein